MSITEKKAQNLPNQFALFQVWFKNRRAKCRQQHQQQQNIRSDTRITDSSGPSSATTSTRTSSTRPAAPTRSRTTTRTSPAIRPSTNIPPATISPPVVVKKEQQQQQQPPPPPQIHPASYKATNMHSTNGTITPLGSSASTVMTPSPPMTPSTNTPVLGFQQEAAPSCYNTFNWSTNGVNSTSHYYGQNYGHQAYYSPHVDYFNHHQQNGQTHMHMGNNHHHVGTPYHQMNGYAEMTGMPPHQSFPPRANSDNNDTTDNSMEDYMSPM